MKSFLVLSLIMLWIAAGCEGFFLEYLRNKYNSFVQPKNQTETTQAKSEFQAQDSYIPYPVPIAYGYGSGIVVEYGGKSYYVGPTSYPQAPATPTFPYKGGPVMTADGGYGSVDPYTSEQVYGYPQSDYYYSDNYVDPYLYLSQRRKL